MPRTPSQRIPAYRLYRRTGQAVVTLSGKDHYLGPYKSQASREEYDRLITEWLANGRSDVSFRKPAELTVSELMLAYLRFAEGFYVDDRGIRTKEYAAIKSAMRPLRRLYGRTPASPARQVPRRMPAFMCAREQPPDGRPGSEAVS